jgi:hypothetical protein
MIHAILFTASAVCFFLALVGLKSAIDLVTLGLLLLAAGHIPFGEPR